MENQTLKQRIDELRCLKDSAKTYRERIDCVHQLAVFSSAEDFDCKSNTGCYALLNILEASYKKEAVR